MRLLALMLFALSLQGVDVRSSPADYPTQGKGKDFNVGAEYTVRTFLANGHSFTVEDYLLVEVGVFPEAGETKLNLERFKLRINGKNMLLPQTPGIVAASIKYPDWSQKPSVQAQAGPVIFGRTQPIGRFPGDARQTRQPINRPQREEEAVDYSAVLTSASLPEIATKRPVAGYIFFAFDGKLKSIKTVELLVDGIPLSLR
jgi:hypothetical protein